MHTMEHTRTTSCSTGDLLIFLISRQFLQPSRAVTVRASFAFCQDSDSGSGERLTEITDIIVTVF